ncbi:MAG: class I SAM-dependent methyltransferase [Deltaproteobacteria bacterium]|nr:class I SAM-dependent methyltransferase [Deltaproteobacteria bacterium]
MNDKMDAFSKKMADILNHGALNLAMALGYRHRLFDVLEDLGRPATVSEIAGASGLNARYLREWLGVMATGRIVEISPGPDGEEAYLLPPDHAAFLTRKAGRDDLGVYTQEIPLLASSALEPVDRGFKTGEGVPFACYPDFQRFMAELANAGHRHLLVERFIPAVDKGRLQERLEEGIRVCDLGCGEGVALNLMARAFPRSRFVGIDIDEQAVETGRAEARETGLENAEFRVVDAAGIEGMEELTDRFDWVWAFDAVHDQTRPLEAHRGVRHMLAPGGMFSMVDIDAASDHAGNLDHPMGPFLYTVSLMHCMPVGLNDGGMGLGMMWGRERAEALLREAGFEEIEMEEMAHDPFNLHFLCRVRE